MNTENELCFSEIPTWALETAPGGKNVIVDFNLFLSIFLLQAFLLCIVILSYLGNEGGRLFFGLEDFLGVGTSVGFTIVIPLVFITYLWDGNILVFVS